MSLEILKGANKWLLTGLIALTPYMCLTANLEDRLNNVEQEDFSFDVSRVKKHKHRDRKRDHDPIQTVDPELQLRLVHAFEKLIIDVHDFVLVGTWGIPEVPFPIFLLADDALNIEVILSPINGTAAAEFTVLLGNFFLSGETYITAFKNRCTTPDGTAEARSQWLFAGQLLANFLNGHNKSLKPGEEEKVQVLFSALVEAFIDLIENILPPCVGEGPADAMASDAAYQQIRILTYDVAQEVATTFSSLETPANGTRTK